MFPNMAVVVVMIGAIRILDRLSSVESPDTYVCSICGYFSYGVP